MVSYQKDVSKSVSKPIFLNRDVNTKTENRLIVLSYR